MYRGGGEIGGGDIKITDCATTQPDTASAATRLHHLQTWGRRKSLLDEQATLWRGRSQLDGDHGHRWFMNFSSCSAFLLQSACQASSKHHTCKERKGLVTMRYSIDQM